MQFGRGREKLVIFPPLADALYEVTDYSLYLRFLFHELAKKYSVTVLGRRRNMPVGYLSRDMALEYAEVFGHSLGRCHVFGISLGGLIAQHFAGEFPQYVDRLILAGSALRMSPEGLEMGKRWITWARLGQWDEIYRENAAVSYQRTARLFVMKLIRSSLLAHLKGILTGPDDFIISGEAALLHDSARELGRIQAPTLIFGGDKDLFFSEQTYRETAAGIPNSKLVIFKGGRHAVYEEHMGEIVRAMEEVG